MLNIKTIRKTLTVFTPQFMEEHRCCIYADAIKNMIRELNDGEILEGEYIIDIYKEPDILESDNE